MTPEKEETPVEPVENRWPVLYAERSGGSNHHLYVFPYANSRGSDTEHQTYYPASHPAVLSKEEKGK